MSNDNSEVPEPELTRIMLSLAKLTGTKEMLVFVRIPTTCGRAELNTTEDVEAPIVPQLLSIVFRSELLPHSLDHKT